MSALRRVSLRSLLPILRCPVCHGRLARVREQLVCRGAHTYSIDSHGTPALGTLTPAPSPGDPAFDEEDTAAYAAMRAYAALTLGRGESEGLYRTVSDLLLRNAGTRAPSWVLDVGCGTGRTVVDAATAFPKARIVGLDRSASALRVAYSVARLRGPSVVADLRRWGFGERVIEAWNLSNTLFIQAEAERLPIANAGEWAGFDAVTCVNLLDRADDPVGCLTEIERVLRIDGSLILATPLNWRQDGGHGWEEVGSLTSLESMVANAGLVPDLSFDGLLYREILDVRGSVTDWRVAIVLAHKPRLV